jgi:hypothetical protein
MRYKIIKSLQPLELFDIVTRGFCDNHLPSIKKEIKELKGEWYLTNWCNNIKLDLLTFYLSDSGFCLWTSKEEAHHFNFSNLEIILSKDFLGIFIPVINPIMNPITIAANIATIINLNYIF